MEEGVKSLERAFQIVEQVSVEKNGIGITELSVKLGMYKSTVHRVLNTLVHLGYVEQDRNTEKYKLGYRWLAVSSRLLNNLDIRKVAYPYLQDLADHTGEVIHLVVLDGHEVVYIEKVEGNQTIRMHSQIGKRVPVHCTGVGKAILAFLPPAALTKVLSGCEWHAHTPYTLKTENELLRHLEKVRKQGYAFDLEENELGISCAAAPIWDYTGKVAASISVSGPTTRMNKERLEDTAKLVREYGRKISVTLGYSNEFQTIEN
ncbi:IclR family transcriptional regulator [Ammoniphilus resinae]|uniref:DNA-binding IclR family transcriptional regulator n=1 Tax=Ammoniphilus resinae TaxID=861532 RepID=A0ABS4GLT5_9BACL|nr:IclR family transcriptional regulator [Ammoniphilus resinae]MBP1931209.1 DNA-binding IclR family transcriptional regulator [Ammoniphilus resinae]